MRIRSRRIKIRASIFHHILPTVDPIFGWTDVGSYWVSINDKICGTSATCPEDGTGESITAYIRVIGSLASVKCALYDPFANLVENGTTEEKTLNAGFEGWVTFNFGDNKPSLTGGETYSIVAWGKVSGALAPIPPFKDVLLAYGPVSGYFRISQSQAYNDWPYHLPAPSSASDQACSIYCTYLTAAPTYELTLSVDKEQGYVGDTFVFSGVLTSNGTPISGATVTLYKNETEEVGTDVTDDDGSYSIYWVADAVGTFNFHSETTV